MAQSTRLPQLALTGAVGGASSQLSSQSLGPLLIEHIGASLSGPLLNDGSREQVTVNETKAPSRRRISIKKPS